MEKLWTKQFIFLTFSLFLIFTGFYFLLPTLPLYIKKLGSSESEIGLIVGLFTISAVLFRPVIGGMLDRFGRQPFIIWGVLLFVVSMYLYDWVSGIFVLMLLRFIHGLSWAASTTSVGTAITDIIPASRRGEGMGWYGIGTTLAMAIGPLLGLWILNHYSFHTLFLTATVITFIAFLILFFTKTPFKSNQNQQKRIEIFDPSLLPVSIVIFFLAVSYGGITTFLPLFADSLKVNAGTFFLVYAIALTLSRPISGKLSDRFSEKAVLIPSLILTCIGLIWISYSEGLVGLIIAAILYGIGFGSAQPALQTAIINLAHPDRKGVANASFFTAFDLGIGLGSIILGWISQITSYEILFLAASISVILSLLLLITIVKQPQDK
ncbi:Predicted arabinose efflux permease, MFS family [Seinonella peptonophila]|uniref:Predicted arabinose efflux permease, MFS family n=1 Tax=Seinonella peptonophila TaxID=112248 RepID=A0A1M5AK60_9BACL|nr:MFS transporter [Seinonella peptonophila]SHF30613.1 Predicted arabinose efflux permease, MFS family [Seinonella peptonophila]